MEKQLKDYLPYYIGQKIIHTADNDIITLLGVDVSDEFPAAIIGKTDCIILSVPDTIKLVLRKLEDLTDEEKKQIWLLIFGRPFRDNGSIRWIDKEDSTCAKRWVMSSGVERVGIEMSGQVWADSDLRIYKFNPHIITHYLCSIGIDLFGLIDAGLAIDAKTIVNE